ncbi:1-deoxy-D-xylulose-5-phosphate synthase N-terminal domain-containing protein, partial [Streptomyces microflavus]
MSWSSPTRSQLPAFPARLPGRTAPTPRPSGSPAYGCRSPPGPVAAVKVLWDTGHQSYVHKLLTGRQDFS